MEVRKKRNTPPTLQRSQSTSSSSSGSRNPPPPALPSRNSSGLLQQHQQQLQQQQQQQHRRRPPDVPSGGSFVVHERTRRQLGEVTGAAAAATGVAAAAAAGVSRSSSMDRNYFSKTELTIWRQQQQQQQQPYRTIDGIFTSDIIDGGNSNGNTSNSGFSQLFPLSGRHTHVFSPTRETLLEHDLRNDGVRISPQKFQQREMDELRARCAQMEKTMRWWSDCTANWREKWSKVRAERNRYKDEVKRLRTATALAATADRVVVVAAVTREDQGCQTEDQDLLVEEEDMTVTSANFLALDPTRMTAAVLLPHPPSSEGADSGLAPSLPLSSSAAENTAVGEDRIARFLDDAVSSLAGVEVTNMLKFRLDEAIKTVDVERSDKRSLQAEIESLHQELSSLECQCDELRLARQESSRELLVARSSSQEQTRSLQMRLEEQLSKKSKADQIVGHLREELERLQSENAEEWGRRERLDTEMQAVERDNRKLRAQVDELKERTKRLTTQTNEQVSSELSRLQGQVESGSRETLELRHQHARLRKSHAEKMEEMGHLQRRSDNAEKEVRKLRARIDELKKELGRAEDDNDQSANTIRRLQRTNDELLSQADGCQVQIEHLTSRLRALPPTDLLGFRRPSRLLASSSTTAGGENGNGDDSLLRPLSSSSEESLPIFDEDDDDDEEEEEQEIVNMSHEIETDV